MTVSQTLSKFVAGLRLEDVPAAVSERARYLALDAIGVALASSRNDFAAIALNGVKSMGGTGDSHVFGMNTPLPLRDAILMNGLLVHGLDYDDTYLPGSIHLCATAVPSAFGIAAQRHLSGKALLTALIVGLESAARISQAGRGNIHKAGFHPTSVCGAFGSALVAGKLMGLTEEQLTLAQGIALATASGTVQPMQDGTWTKRMHPGWASASGVTSASMAAAGYTGPSAAYEGRFGFYNVFLGPLAQHAEPEYAVAELGQRWEYPTASIKLYPACHHMHAFVNAAKEIRAQLGGNLRQEDIASIHLGVAEVAVPLVCEPAEEKFAPYNSYIAQFSVQFSVACGLLRGAFGLPELEQPVLEDENIRALARKTTYEIDPESGFPKRRSGVVTVRMTDGRTLTVRNSILPEEPASNEEIVAKFMGNAEMAMPASRAREVRDMILGLEAEQDAARLMQALGQAGGPAK